VNTNSSFITATGRAVARLSISCMIFSLEALVFYFFCSYIFIGLFVTNIAIAQNIFKHSRCAEYSSNLFASRNSFISLVPHCIKNLVTWKTLSPPQAHMDRFPVSVLHQRVSHQHMNLISCILSYFSIQ
jgi:hypothetical protein